MGRTAWTAIDLFGGCGGLTTGLKQAGFKILATVESDELATDTYFDNHPEVNVVKQDIRKIQRRHLLPAGVQSVDLIAGCPPCQGFSRVRRRNKSRSVRDERNQLVDDFFRLVKSIKPKAVFLENVPGIEKYGRFKKFLSWLNAHYKVTVKTLDLCDYGVPQRRRRLVVLAGQGFEISLPKKSRSKPTVKSAISELPPPSKSRNRLHREVTKNAPDVRQRIKATPQNGGSRTDLLDDYTLACHAKFNGFKDVYGRMAWNEPSPTITGGCINASKGRFLHPTSNRVITLYEAQILQSFPRSYRFRDARGRYGIAEMIGNALPPEFARRVACSIVRSLENQRHG